MKSRLAGLFAGGTDKTLVQLFRYVLVGGLAFLVDFSALALLKEFVGVHYLWAAALAFGLGLVTNYLISVTWVFDKRTVKSWQTEFAIFALLGLLGLGINEISMYGLTELLGVHYLGSKIASTVATLLWNFSSRKALLFSSAAIERKNAISPHVVAVVKPVG